MPRFAHRSNATVGSHRFDVWDCEDGDEPLASELGNVIRELYVDPDPLREALKQAAADLGGTLDGANVDATIDSCIRANVPEPGTHSVPSLDLARNEIAEVLAFLALPEVHSVAIPASRIAIKDVPRLPARGLDLLGLRLDPLAVVLTEAKASSVPDSPPRVVCDANDSMQHQSLAFLADRDKIIRELTWAFKHARDDTTRSAASKALLFLQVGRLPIVIAPVLLRPAERHGENDFGCFKESPELFSPAEIKFCVLRISGSLEDLARDAYSGARAA